MPDACISARHSNNLSAIFCLFNHANTISKKKTGIHWMPGINPEPKYLQTICYNTLLSSFSRIPMAGSAKDAFAPKIPFNWRSGVVPLLNAYFIHA